MGNNNAHLEMKLTLISGYHQCSVDTGVERKRVNIVTHSCKQTQTTQTQSLMP